jgi:hypothetical protein
MIVPALDREFWEIILTSFTMEEIDLMAEYARIVETSVSWN